jgi:hypothetical protein
LAKQKNYLKKFSKKRILTIRKNKLVVILGVVDVVCATDRLGAPLPGVVLLPDVVDGRLVVHSLYALLKKETRYMQFNFNIL